MKRLTDLVMISAALGAAVWIVLIAFSPIANAADAFNGVNHLNAIKADYDKLGHQPALKLDKERNKLQKEATSIIQTMPDKDKKLSSQQIGALTNLLSVAVPVDPTSAIVENNAEIIKANLPKLKAEIEKLPASDKEQILYSIDLVVNPGEAVQAPSGQ